MYFIRCSYQLFHVIYSNKITIINPFFISFTQTNFHSSRQTIAQTSSQNIGSSILRQTTSTLCTYISTRISSTTPVQTSSCQDFQTKVARNLRLPYYHSSPAKSNHP